MLPIRCDAAGGHPARPGRSDPRKPHRATQSGRPTERNPMLNKLFLATAATAALAAGAASEGYV